RESRALAFTPGLLSGALEGRTDSATLLTEGGYLEEAGSFWTRSGRPIYDSTRFYQATQSVDPFGNRYHIELDARSLLVTRTEDPFSNVTLAENDYRILGPWQSTDPNGNRVQLSYGALQRIERLALKGKVGESVGDTLE